MNELPWVEKYRPTNFKELLSHDRILNIITNIKTANDLPHLLFHGPSGTGKTSLIMLIAKKLYEDDLNTSVLELNGSDDRGITTVREKIKNFSSTKSFNSTVKLIILDEVDSMTFDAQVALRRAMEKYTTNVRFCLICNYINKLNIALQSRCKKFFFSPLNDISVEKTLNRIIDNEDVNITKNAKKFLIKIGNGDARRSINILQMLNYEDKITKLTINKKLGIISDKKLNTLVDSLLEQNFTKSYKILYKLIYDKHLNFHNIIENITEKILKMKIDNLDKIIIDLAKFEEKVYKINNYKLHFGALISIFYFYD